MARFNDFSIYAQAVRNNVAAARPFWDTEPACVVVFQNAVVELASLTDTTAAQTWVASTTSAVIAAFS